MKYWLLLLLCWPLTAGAQSVGPAKPVPGSSVSRQPIVLTDTATNPIDIAGQALFYENQSEDTLPLSAKQIGLFRPFLQQPTDRMPTRAAASKWIRFTLQNGSPDKVLKRWLYVGSHRFIYLYALDSLNRSRLLIATGGNIPANVVPAGARGRMAVPIVLMSHQRQTYLLRVATFQSFDLVNTMLHTSASYDKFLYDFHQRQLPAFTFYAGLIACLLFIGLFSAAQYLTNRDIIYAWYSLYILATCLYFFRIVELYFQLDWWLPNQPALRLAFLPVSELAIQFFYLLFFGTLLELPRYQPRLWRWYRYLLLVVVVLSIILLVSFLFSDLGSLLHAYTSRLSSVVILMLLLSSLLLTGLALQGRHALRSYAFLGLVLLMSGAAGTLILNRTGALPPTNPIFRMPSLLFGFGVLLEVFCFSLALGRRTRLIEIEKKQIQQRYAQDLETQLAGRTLEIEQQSRLLEAQRIQQLEMAFDQKLADSEMTALRAQMNPHFIFNCLNSIKLYTLQNDTDRASDYLTKFARLIRLVLENSREDRIPLRNELEALQLYSDLEAMRFKQKVTIRMDIDPAIDQQYITIPPLLLQPYVENAIWHGLMHKPEGGTVTIVVHQPSEHWLHIEITDDGVGRARAATLKSKSAGNLKSFGMQVTADRIRMINQLYNTQTKARILDLVAPNGESLGTKIVLDIPV